VRPPPGGQQLELALRQSAYGGHADRAKAGEPAPWQIIERHAQDREDRYAEEWPTVQRPGPRCPLSVAPELAGSIWTTSDKECCGARPLLLPQPRTLLDPLARGGTTTPCASL